MEGRIKFLDHYFTNLLYIFIWPTKVFAGIAQTALFGSGMFPISLYSGSSVKFSFGVEMDLVGVLQKNGIRDLNITAFNN
jgi:hypothetical protein